MNNLISNVGKPDVCAFIGRFEPEHRGHDQVICQGLKTARQMVVLVGSAHEPRTYRNPFTTDERIGFIRATFNDDPRLSVVPLEDSNYNLNEWLDRTHRTVETAWAKSQGIDTARPAVALIGHAKDATSYYLNLFPRWSSINVPVAHPLSATAIRAELFGDLGMIQPALEKDFNDEILRINGSVPLSRLFREHATQTSPAYFARYTEMAHARARAFLAAQRTAGAGALVSGPVLDFLEAFIAGPAYEGLAREFGFVAKYQYAWAYAPYAPSFLTTDAVIIQSGHVLMVKRDNYPGKGLWALPGGFVEQDETIEQACLREVAEETGLKVPPAVLQGRIQAREVFDAPFRSSRGRTVSHTFLIHLKPGPLAKMRASGQAGETAKVAWIPLPDLRRDQCFEDHYPITTNMAARCRPVEV